MAKIILASGSPRRKELLGSLGIEFEICPADVDETIDTENSLVDEIEKLSYRKAFAVFKENKDAIVIGSDTIVTIDDEILGKPKTDEKAKEMLEKLSGRAHKVVTAVSIISKEKSETFSSVSDVYFREMSDEEIDAYVATKEPHDKAGAYAIQGYAARFISRIDGDYYAIIGLPVSELYSRLKKFL